MIIGDIITEDGRKKRYEIEARFKESPNITSDVIQKRVREFMKHHEILPVLGTGYRVYYPDNFRRSHFESGNVVEDTIEIKHDIISSLTDYDFTINVSEEERRSSTGNREESARKEMVRESYDLSKLGFPGIELHSTTVSQASRKGKQFSTVQVEVELLPIANSDESWSLDDLGKFGEAVILIYMRIKDTPKLYTSIREREIFDYYATLMNIKVTHQGFRMTSKNLVNPRNIKAKDLQVGGLVTRHDKDGYHFSVGYKTDGERRFLVSYGRDTFLIYSRNCSYLGKNASNRNMILEGELVKMDGRELFIVHDMIGSESRPERMNKAKKEVELLIPVDSKLEIYMKSFSNIFHVDEFNDIVPRMIEEAQKGEVVVNGKKKFLVKVIEGIDPISVDGLIFVPSCQYNIITDVPQFERDLTRYMDILKWKFPELLSTDYRYIDGSLYVYDQAKGEEVKFLGNQAMEFNESMLEYGGLVPENGDIVEAVYDRTSEKVRISRIRSKEDKTEPNTLYVAMENWRGSLNPIGLDDFKGTSFNLIDKFSNIIKTSLIERSTTRSGDIILDIGTGTGGDLRKYEENKVSKLFAVEPIHAEELRANIVRYGITDMKVEIIETGGEDTEKISSSLKGVKVDLISMMLSLSFFKDKNLDKLIETIDSSSKGGTRFVFYTIDGDKLLAMADRKGSEFSINDREFKVDAVNNEVELYFPGTIVDHQRESIVDLNKIKLKLEERGWVLESQDNFERDRFILTEEGSEYLDLFVSGNFRKVSTRKAKTKEVIKEETKEETKEVRKRILQPRAKRTPTREEVIKLIKESGVGYKGSKLIEIEPEEKERRIVDITYSEDDLMETIVREFYSVYTEGGIYHAILKATDVAFIHNREDRVQKFRRFISNGAIDWWLDVLNGKYYYLTTKDRKSKELLAEGIAYAMLSETIEGYIKNEVDYFVDFAAHALKVNIHIVEDIEDNLVAIYSTETNYYFWKNSIIILKDRDNLFHPIVSSPERGMKRIFSRDDELIRAHIVMDQKKFLWKGFKGWKSYNFEYKASSSEDDDTLTRFANLPSYMKYLYYGLVRSPRSDILRGEIIRGEFPEDIFEYTDEEYTNLNDTLEIRPNPPRDRDSFIEVLKETMSSVKEERKKKRSTRTRSKR